VTTCRHLEVGDLPDARGRFYPRCGLGDRSARLRWLALVGPRRFELQRRLQAEFDEFTLQRREALIAAKRLALAEGGPATASLKLKVDQFIAEVSAFISERCGLYEEAGLTPVPLVELVAEWTRAWQESRSLSGPASIGDPMRPFASSAAEKVDGPARAEPAAPSPLYQDEILTVARTEHPPGLYLAGEVDAGNSSVLSEALSAIGLRSDLHVDMGGLEFCSLDGMRALVRASQTLPDGCRLHVRNLPPHLERVLEMTGWAELPNLVVGGGAPAQEAAG
jgi:anti-anti-sigma factor